MDVIPGGGMRLPATSGSFGRRGLHAWNLRHRSKQALHNGFSGQLFRYLSFHQHWKRPLLSQRRATGDDEFLSIDEIIEQAATDTDSEEDDDESEIEEGEFEYPDPPRRMRQLSELLLSAGCVESSEGIPDIGIENVITCNSDTSAANSLYVCVPSEDGEEDGHDWANEAAALGAVAVLAERALPDCSLPVVVVGDTLKALSRVAAEFYDMPAASMSTVAFIGSYGKTVTSWLTRGIFEENEELTLMVGDTEYALAEDRLTREGEIWVADEEDVTLSRDCSVPFHIVPYKGKYEIPLTTPDGLHLQKVLAGGADRGAESAIIEICPSSLRDCRADALKPNVVVFTNAYEEKAMKHGDNFDDYLERIGECFASLDASQIAVINKDDIYGDSLQRLVEDTGAQVLTYGVKAKDADVYAEKVKSSIWETEILVRTPVGRLEIIIPLLGEFNVSNVLAAVAVGLSRGIKLVNIVAGIEAVDIIPGRTELVEEGQPFPVIVDAASTPSQISKLIDEVKEAGARKTILVMGCKGSSSVDHRAAMGSMVHFKADTVFLTNDSPGICPPDRIINDMISGMPEEVTGRHAGSYHNWLQDPHRVPQWFQPWLLRYQSEVGRYIIEDRFSAIRVAVGMAKPKDVVIIAGRGHIDYMEYWDGQSPLPDIPAEGVLSGENEVIDILNETFFDDPGLSGSENEDFGTTTLLGWFDDRVEARNAVAKLKYLNGIKDLDRSTIPWTRYPEEREQSGLSATVGNEAAAASGQYLGEYLREIVVENQEREEDINSEEYDDDDDDELDLDDAFESSLDVI